jgi:hypothetical protein
MRLIFIAAVALLGCSASSGESAVAPQATAEMSASATPACPAEIGAAVGTACSIDNQSCGGEACAKSTSFCNVIVCSGGKWIQLEAPPPPGPTPSRDPCANFKCGAGQHCTAPADSPSCVPN